MIADINIYNIITIMKNEEKNTDYFEKGMMFKRHHHSCGGSNPIYCLGVIGAFFYFLQTASGFMGTMLAIGKSFVWPALLMFKLLTYLKM